MKKKWNWFLDHIVFPGIAFGGPIVSLYALWLQSGGISVRSGKPVVSFGFLYIQPWMGLLAVAAGVALGYGIIYYFRREAAKSSDLKKLTSEDFRHTARGFILTFLVSALAAFLLTEVIWVLVGVAAMMFASVGILCYELWVRHEAKARKAESNDGK